ncbi:MAG: hypothetical protein ACXW32_09055, partial [Limisphaerales bacterium]
MAEVEALKCEEAPMENEVSCLSGRAGEGQAPGVTLNDGVKRLSGEWRLDQFEDRSLNREIWSMGTKEDPI